MTCPTCGFFLGQKTEEYDKKKNELLYQYNNI